VFLMTQEVYGNCPKYIQQRRLTSVAVPETAALRTTTLDVRQRSRIAASDTLFIATFHPQGGADASHRGGPPGFVRVLDESRLTFPDYPGNNMFNTLGNLVAAPRAGLLVPDFESGSALQISGRATVEWMGTTAAVRFAIDAVIETPAGIRGRLAGPRR
jgi:predicted pyridoxine 5'-phosphate oxidase superfamily flavin-nucleotide-binding protein